jgi:DNA segregation ATPase FtsK/SpoIIIE, S-DNA-T family
VATPLSMSNQTSTKAPHQFRISEHQRPQRRFIPAARDPWHLPDEKIELPSPSQLPPSPAAVNLITTVLPPIILIGGTLIFSIITGKVNWMLIGPMLIMSLGFPVANLIGLSTQKRTYQKVLESRRMAYQKRLEEAQVTVRQAIRNQTDTLQAVYPSSREIIRIALSQSKLFWSRRRSDSDFLAARIGETKGAPSFAIELPRYLDPNDPLLPLAQQVAGGFAQINGLPALVEFSRIGSIALTGKTSSHVHGVARRIVLDLATHHSPGDLQIAVAADSNEAVNRWEWLKWLPHLDALDGTAKAQRLAFDPPKINRLIEWLHAEFQNRRERLDIAGTSGACPAIFVLLDDTGGARQNPDIALIADLGATVGICLMFVGGRNWPHECRARLELLDDRHFRLLETWSRDSRPMEGEFESLSAEECLKAARALSGLQVGGARSSTPLPPNIRISEVLGTEYLTLNAIKSKWELEFPAKEQLQFPIGVRSRRDHLDLAWLNLLPEKADGHDVGGYDAYHTILIGTTGSGKSEFMKSLVMGAALRYPPSLLNFFFLDFKGGAAFSVFENLPHVSGIVTNLSPELVERGLDSIRNEIDRRQEEFARARVRDIWSYNARGHRQPMPQMILFLDEFARGLADFPRLRETLDVLVRQGRSLGMYLVLANQDVSSEVDKLLNNVGWRIALKVAKPEEMTAMVGRGHSIATRAGQGYLRRGDEIVEFQAGYAGLPVRDDAAAVENEFTIYQVDADGSFQKFYTKSNLSFSASPASRANQASQKEEELIVDILRQATEELQIKPAPKIYLEPLPKVIKLEDVLDESGIEKNFNTSQWYEKAVRGRLIAPIGEEDMPRDCRQEQLVIDFEDQDGHLWIVGSAGSGKELVLSSVLLALAHINTPKDLQFYMLELGAGDLKQFEMLPHTGAVIRPQIGEKERFKRLLDYLEGEMDRRTAGYDYSETQSQEKAARIFFVINNFAELRASFPDEAERLARFVRDGKRAGIHLILITNRATELAPSLRNNIARRLVLQLGSKDEHLELVGRESPQILAKINGRGYWVDGAPYECQIAFFEKPVRDLIRAMDESWKGERPRKIEVLPVCIPLDSFVDQFGRRENNKQATLAVGRAYETLDDILMDLDSDQFSSQTWLVLGGKESGKSNFLCCAALGVKNTSEEERWDVRAYALRRSPLINMGKEKPEIHVFNDLESIVQDIGALIAERQVDLQTREKRILLLVDDLGAAFQPGRDKVGGALNQLASYMEHDDHITLIAAGMLDELRMQISAPIVKLLKQSRMGMVFSKDNSDMDWLSAQLQLEQRKMELHPGRGFFISRGKPQLVQTPFWGSCPGN